jgi:hypothetical protein
VLECFEPSTIKSAPSHAYRSRNFIWKIHVSRTIRFRIYSFISIFHLNRVTNCNPTFAFQVHVVKQLCFSWRAVTVPPSKRSASVCTVVNMCNNAEIPYFFILSICQFYFWLTWSYFRRPQGDRAFATILLLRSCLAISRAETLLLQSSQALWFQSPKSKLMS